MELRQNKAGDFDAELCEDFFRRGCRNAGLTLHLNLQYGKIRIISLKRHFKAFGQALRRAAAVDPQIARAYFYEGRIMIAVIDYGMGNLRSVEKSVPIPWL